MKLQIKKMTSSDRSDICNKVYLCLEKKIVKLTFSIIFEKKLFVSLKVSKFSVIIKQNNFRSFEFSFFFLILILSFPTE